MKKIKMSKLQARRFLVNYHGLDSYNHFEGEEGVLEFMRKVGCIQYDPLNVVGRNPDLVLQSRIKGYTSDILEKLLYTDRSLVDGWDKMMAIYRKEDWAPMGHVRNKHIESFIGTMNNRGTMKALDLIDEIRNIIKQNGPIQARDINIGVSPKGSWGHRKLSSVALDYMFNNGELGIFRKNNTQKVYDLIENLLPTEIIDKDSFNSNYEFHKWYFKRRIGSVGMIWKRSGGGWLGHFLSNKELRNTIIDELLSENSIVPVSIEGINDDFYIRTEDVKNFDFTEVKEDMSMRFLAPLDNILWDRSMIEEIFDFKYRWEVYVPKDKRKYGYYVLPVLYGDKLIARFEPELHRGNEPLVIKRWWWEEGIIITDKMKKSVKDSLEEFCNYLQADGLAKESISKIY
ncbi:winged helix-turn-helix domain-containing protein [Sporosalibacterium faouarense]|uniref:winged helix-turn-helix domain-containing protein n=1 Tax=Sporosalibacterium faouarense TaxID=516123 RepID=UPI00192BDC05|nr:crosslink repair DNA glycosylase YcaQ family protein [Sporosalibacterium faouarense]